MCPVTPNPCNAALDPELSLCIYMTSTAMAHAPLSNELLERGKRFILMLQPHISFGERFILEGKSRFAHTDFGLVSGIRLKQARFDTPNMLCGPLNRDSLLKA